MLAEEVVEFNVIFGNGLSYPNVNWRETVNCPKTFFNNRMRFALMIIDTLGRILKDDKVYIIEANPRASRTVPFICKAYKHP